MSSLLPKYETKTFTEVYNNSDDFVNDYKDSGLYDANNHISDTNAAVLFYLLYAKYGNSPIANYDENQFKYKLWTVIYQYGPSWERRLDIQATLRTMTEADIMTGAKAINDHAMAMGDDSIAAMSDPTKIDSKTGTYYTKSKIDAYANLWELLRADVTNEFVNKFKVCFKSFVMGERPTIYRSEEDTDYYED